MTNNSKNLREGFKVVLEDRWSLNSSGRKHDFDCSCLHLPTFRSQAAIVSENPLFSLFPIEKPKLPNLTFL